MSRILTYFLLIPTIGFAQSAKFKLTDTDIYEGQYIVTNEIRFDFMKWSLTKSEFLDSLTTFLQERPIEKVEIFRMEFIQPEYSAHLHMRRARAIEEYLVNKGISRERLTVDGETELINENTHGDGKQNKTFTKITIVSTN